MQAPRFAVDRMLGRLARWLRVLGFDAVYRPEMPGERLLALAAREQRVVLTRDARLRCPRGRVRVVHLAADRFRDQLRELDRTIPLGGVAGRPSRCVECNLAVEPLAADDVPASVPEYVRATQREFHRCPRCRRIYWPATHRERMDAEIAALGLTEPAPVGGEQHA
ncbi:MAG: Mut7-C RNAse domain-containing protein [Thermodesulfobacteriota bacterium]